MFNRICGRYRLWFVRKIDRGLIAHRSKGAVHGGIGLHVTQLRSIEQSTIGLKVFYASQYFFTMVTACNRLSILSLYIEIFRRKSFLIAANITTILVVGWWLGSMLTSILICRPISLNWDKSINGTCGDVFKVELASASWNLIFDLTLVVLPMPVLWTLQMARRIKLGISATFGLGIAIAGVNIGRIVQTAVSNQQDFTYVAVDASILAAAEASIGLIVVCAPTLGPIIAPSRYGDSADSDRRRLKRKPYTGFSKQTTIGSNGRIGVFRHDKSRHLSAQRPAGKDDFEMLANGSQDGDLANTKDDHIRSNGSPEAFGNNRMEAKRDNHVDLHSTPREV
ncbi:MAG: hypothetical protein Q9187_004441 [Circinaria calcarea]